MKVNIEVKFTVYGEDGSELGLVSDSKWGVRMTQDEVQVAAAGLAYGLVEDAWGLVDDE